MDYDIGPTGFGLLALISLAFGVVAQIVLWRSAPRWLWLVAALGWFAGGLIASEVVFAWATEAELQPIVDGLLLDESLLGGLVVGLAVVGVTWLATRRSRVHQQSPT